MNLKDSKLDIITVFKKRIEPQVVDPNAELGESIDKVLGFTSEISHLTPAEDMPSAEPTSWRMQTDRYSSEAEYRLQVLVDSVLTFVSIQYRLNDLPSSDSICLRMIEHEHSSPSVRYEAGYYYILLPTGYVKSLENVWRVHFALVERGKALPPSTTQIKNHYVGGALAERSLSLDFSRSSQDLMSLFFDAGWHRWYIGTDHHMMYPEEILAVGDRLAVECLGGLYSTAGKPDDNYRISSSSNSRWLTRLVIVYVVIHEIAHILFKHQGLQVDEPRATDVETLCDLLATTYFP